MVQMLNPQAKAARQHRRNYNWSHANRNRFSQVEEFHTDPKSIQPKSPADRARELYGF